MNEATVNPTTELPSGGTDQTSAASQAAAGMLESSSPAAPQAERLYQADAAAKQQAPAGNEPDHADEAVADIAQASSEETAAPGQYEFKPVEGVQLSGEVLGKFSEVARELNLSQGAAQKMLDQVAPAIARQQYAAIQQLNEQWVSAVKADKEIGGEKLGANLAIAKKARDAFGTDGLRKLLNESRIGNHPEVIRFFVRAGQAISEDSFVPGGTRPSSGGKDAASVLYGKTN